MIKVLVVEDEQLLREGIVDTLQYEGFQTLEADNGLDGIRAAEEHLPDLIVCDILMPELDGYSVYTRLRSQPATSLIPFIFLTAKASRADMRYGMALGADDYLTKPFTNRELLSTIHARLEKQATIRRELEKGLDQLRNSVLRALPHELRTPLTGIIGFAELLAMDADKLMPSQVSEMAQGILLSGKRLLKLVENYLLYSQIEVWSSSPEHQRSLREIDAAEAGLIISNSAEIKALEWERGGDLVLDLNSCHAKIAPEALTKIVDELVDNALKFSRPGTSIIVRSTTEDQRFVLHIIDEGTGMTAEQIQRIGAHMQFDRVLHEQQGGGMGLIISKRLAMLYGGSLEILSEPGHGVDIRVEFVAGTTDQAIIEST